MYDRNYLITMALMGFFLTVSLFYLAATTDAFSSRNNTAREDFLLPVFEAIPEQTVNCVICHMRPENLTGHINGGNYCASCHGYPDPMAPSFGNLITIHTTRGKTCDICHIQDIQSLHKIDSAPAKYTVFTT